MGVKKNRLSGNHNSHHTTVIREAVIEVNDLVVGIYVCLQLIVAERRLSIIH